MGQSLTISGHEDFSHPARMPTGRGRGGPPRAKCADGSRPTCSDGTEPQRRRGAPPCPDDLPPLTCADGSTPLDKEGNPVCPKEERLCCDESVLEGRGRRPRCEDGTKPVCSLDQCD